MVLHEGENLKTCGYQTRFAVTETQRNNHWASRHWNGRYSTKLYSHLSQTN